MPANKIFDCQYALSDGIKIATLLSTSEHCSAHAMSSSGNRYHIPAGKWCETGDGALKISEDMKRKRVLSLQKQIAKIEKLSFKLPETAR